MEDTLGDRMKGYENINRFYLTKRMPMIIRIDGRAFHTLTKSLSKPFDPIFMDAMFETARSLLENVAGCKLAYVQSDEISLLVTDYDNLETQPWFDKNLQKIVSVSASIATVAFNNYFDHMMLLAPYNSIHTATFDSRAFVLPKEEVCNYFIWRQQDATRNAIQSLGQAYFSHKELQGRSCEEIQDMLFLQKGINFDDLSTSKKRGACIYKEKFKETTFYHNDREIPIFSKNREYIERFI